MSEEQLVDQLLGGERVVGRHVIFVRDRGVQHVRLALGKVRPPKLGPALLRAQEVDAGRDQLSVKPNG